LIFGINFGDPINISEDKKEAEKYIKKFRMNLIRE